jgi:hypothetical protein
VSPKAFLHELGIKPNRKGKYSARYQQIIGQLPAKEANQGTDIMSVEEMNPLFIDEEIAVETLGGNFDRLANSMERLDVSPIFKKGRLERVCELGGGTGIIGMWLAKNGKCDFCEVVDHADNPLGIGRKWAERFSMQRRVSFKHESYAAQDLRACFKEAQRDTKSPRSLVRRKCTSGPGTYYEPQANVRLRKSLSTTV